MRKTIIVFIALAIFSTTQEIKAEDNVILPFGIKLGEKLQDKIKIKEIANMIFSVNPPKPISTFEEYWVAIDDSKKITKVSSFSQTYKNDEYCSESQSKFSSLENSLIKKYGEPANKFDFLKSGALWKDDRDYRMSLVKNERHHAIFWEYGEYAVSIEEQADIYGCYIVLRYEHKELHKKNISNKKQKEEELL